MDPTDTVINDDAPPPPESAGNVQKMADRFKQNMAGLYDQKGELKKGATDAPDDDKPKPKAKAKESEKKEEPAKSKEEPKKETPKEEDEVPKILKGKAADEFRNLRSKLTAQIEARSHELTAAREELAQAKAAVDKAKSSPAATPEELAALRKERDELQSHLERVSLEQSPGFQKRYSNRVQQVAENAVAAAGENKDAVMAVLQLPPSPARKKQLNALLSEMEQSDQISITVAVNEMDRIRMEREHELANHKETLRREQEAAILENQQREDATQAFRNHTLKQVLSLAPKHFEVFQRTGDAEKDALVDDAVKDVTDFISGKVDEAKAAFLPVIAAEGLYIKDHVLPGLKAELAEAQKMLKEIGMSSPGHEPSAEEGRKVSKSSSRSSFIDAFNKAQQE